MHLLPHHPPCIFESSWRAVCDPCPELKSPPLLPSFPLRFPFSFAIFFTVFRDALLSHLLPIPPTQYDLIATKLITAGSTLEFLKYSDALFEIVFVGGILQPGGSYVEDGKTERSPFAIIGGKDEIEGTAVAEGAGQKEILAEVVQKVEVLKKVIQRWVSARTRGWCR